MADEQFRSRVYALGVDLYWQKPGSDSEIKMFLECLESLLGRESGAGFRGVQSKSLMDIVQLECISQSSSVLRITNGPLTGRIWINDGELIDAETDGFSGEEAFQRILSWKAGSFESLPDEPNRRRTILKSYNALLLESAQALDELRSSSPPTADVSKQPVPAAPSGLSELLQVEGVEFVLSASRNPGGAMEARGLDNADRIATWMRHTTERFRTLADRLQAGSLEQVTGLGPQRHVALVSGNDAELCVGWVPSSSVDEVRDRMRKVLAIWAS